MEQSLFDIEEFLPEEERNDNEQKPVTCLGMEFESDDARREYFRAELRKKLPELRAIEGFPIGEDDDIINLSDPPYYTACPNPWLNDFIAEWEKEKEQLKAEGKRTDKFEVKEPYASDVSEGKNNPIYLAHSYHTKVPHPAIMRYILHYTQPGDIVFDGFCGTGMTGVAAQLCGSKQDVASLHEKDVTIGVRHGICSDLSPIASLIAASYNLKFNPKEFERKANEVLNQVEKEFGWMYETDVNGRKAKINATVWSSEFVCPNCGSRHSLWDLAVDETKQTIRDSFVCPECSMVNSKKTMTIAKDTVYDNILQDTVNIMSSTPVRISYSISGGGSTNTKPVSDYDLRLIHKIEDLTPQNVYTERMPEGDEARRNDRFGITHTHQFYTKRCFIVLSRIYELVKNDVSLLAWFTSSVTSTTKMNRFRFSGTGVNSGTLYIPSLNWEFTPFNTLRRKITSFVSTFYENRQNSIISIASAVSLDQIASNSVDYMFIDPPFGANLSYSELNTIWEVWIRNKTNIKTEAIVNNSQNKSLFDYQNLMNASFREFYRILKPGKWLTMEFSNTSASVWNSIQTALQGVGFILVNVAALDKKQGSFKAVTTTTAVKQDLIITCFKPTTNLTEKFERSGDTAENVWDFVAELLQHLPVHIVRENKTTAIVERSPKILFDRVIAYYVQHGYPVPMDAQEFQQGLRERFVARDGMYFNAEQAIEYDEKKRLTPEFAELSLFVDSEANGINWLKHTLEQKPMTYADISPLWMQALADGKKGDKMPELMDILKENFIEEEGGYWRIPNPEKEADLEKIRTKKLLREFEHYVEHANLPKSKKLKDARLEALRTGFKQCYKDKEFEKIVKVGEKIPEALLTEDEVLLQYYDIATSRV